MSQDVITCPTCERRTPAARGNCIYCGVLLPVSKIALAPPQRNIDASELAFNTILQPQASADENSVALLATALSIDPAEAQAFVAAEKPVPISRCQSQREAEMITGLVQECGLAATVVADETLKLQTELVRARKITLGEGMIRVHHSGGSLALRLSEVKLLLLGGLRKTRVDYSEVIGGGRGKSGSPLDSAEFSSDETLLDVYASSLEQSLRIRADTFDYSGLVSPLSFRSEINLRTALDELRKLAPQARLDADFGRMRGLLSRAWPERSRSESLGIKRAGLSLRAVSRQSITSDNRDQFERYSRLMFLFA